MIPPSTEAFNPGPGCKHACDKDTLHTCIDTQKHTHIHTPGLSDVNFGGRGAGNQTVCQLETHHNMMYYQHWKRNKAEKKTQAALLCLIITEAPKLPLSSVCSKNSFCERHELCTLLTWNHQPLIIAVCFQWNRLFLVQLVTSLPTRWQKSLLGNDKLQGRKTIRDENDTQDMGEVVKWTNEWIDDRLGERPSSGLKSSSICKHEWALIFFDKKNQGFIWAFNNHTVINELIRLGRCVWFDFSFSVWAVSYSRAMLSSMHHKFWLKYTLYIYTFSFP